MWHERLSRRRLLKLGGVALASGLAAGPRALSFAQSGARTAAEPLRIGFLLPMPTGGTPLRADHLQSAGEMAGMGAMFAEERLGAEVERSGRRLEVLLSNVPDAEAAVRAGDRMAGFEQAVAIAGGYGDEQAAALASVSRSTGTLFFNLGSSSERLRETERDGLTFHVEARDRTYLGAMAAWYGEAGNSSWFLVHDEGEAGEALLASTREALQAAGGGLSEAGSFAVRGSPDLLAAIRAIGESEADLVFLLLDWRAQLDFMGLYDAFGLEARLAGFPFPVTQTRRFYRAAADALSEPAVVRRAALWEATLDEGGAGELNRLFFQRWGRPMDSPAWAAFAAVRVLVDAAMSTGSDSPDELGGFLAQPDNEFELGKGRGTSFDPDDHQLRQSVYLVEIDRTAETDLDAAALVEDYHVPEASGPEAG
jgi:ABC-type branched-subunit amino acid transport system substrate-binding protein